MVQVKGSTLVPRLKFIQERGRGEQKEQALGRLSPEFRQAVALGLLQNQWYPFDYFVQLTQAIDKVFGRGDLSFIPELGRYSAEAALKGIYKVFYKVGSPEFIIKRATRVWSQYYSSGSLTVVTAGPKQVKIVLADFALPLREHCLSVLGWIQKTLEMSAGHPARVEETQCRLKGDTTCEFTAAW